MHNPRTSWDQFTTAGAYGLLSVVGIVVAFIFPPILILYVIGVFVYLLNKGLDGPKARAVPQPNGLWVVFNADGQPITGHVSQSEAMRVLHEQ